MLVLGYLGAALSIYLVSLPLLYCSLGVAVVAGFGLSSVICIDVLTYYFSRHFGMAIGISMSGSGIGLMIISPVLQFAIASYGLEISLIMLAVISCSCFVTGLICQHEAAKKSIQVEFNDSRISWQTYKYIFCSPKLVLLFMFTFLVAISVDAGTTYNIDRAIFLGIGTSIVPYIVSFGGVCNLGARVVAGKLTDLFRKGINKKDKTFRSSKKREIRC